MAGRVAVAYISRPWGVRGEVRAEALTHRVERFSDLRDVVLQCAGRPDRPLELECWRTDAKSLLLKFAGIDAPEQARSILAGGYVTIAPEQRDPLPEGTHYIDDLMDCAVVNSAGEPLGRIVEVVSMPSTDVYVVRGAKGEALVPAVGDFVVEIAPGRVVVRGVEELFGP
jgi:16S rRNA processing protein RimM